MSFRLLTLALLLLLSALPVRAQGGGGMELSATLRIPELIAVMQDEGLAYGADLEAELFPGAGGARWRGMVATIYDESAMLQRFQSAFAAGLADDPQAIAEIAAFFGSPRGQRILALEIAARRALLDKTVEAAAAVTVERMRAANDPQIALLERFAVLNDLVEQNVAAALNASFAFYQGMNDGGAFGTGAMTETEMLAAVSAQEADIRAETESWLYPFLALAYRPLPEDDLRAYLAFSETAAAGKANSAVFAAFDEVFGGIARDLGRAAAAVLAGQDL